MQDILAPKQIEFIINSTAKWNLAHGPVRSGKTMATVFRFMQAVHECPDSKIWMIGHTSTTIYDNVVRLVLEPAPSGVPDPLSIFRPFCSWLDGKRQLRYRDKTIGTVGAKDGGAVGAIQGKTFSLVYCDEMTLYPESIIDMIDTRLSTPHSMGIATMNPSHPAHKLKKWIDWAIEGNPNYYQCQIMLEDNPYVDQQYKDRVKNSLSGVFYKRNYLGLWCLAEGAIFDFFDKKIHVVSQPPRSAHYYIVGIDYGIANAFAAALVGVHTGTPGDPGKKMWVEAEYYWDSRTKGRQKLNSELAEDLIEWLEPYGMPNVYIDPSAASFKLELQRRKLHVIDKVNNQVEDGIRIMTDLMQEGHLVVCERAPNLIREIEGYVWDPKAAERGEDVPLKQNDHAIDALRYAVATHRPVRYDGSEGPLGGPKKRGPF